MSPAIAADTNLYWRLRGTYEQRRATLEDLDPDLLRAMILDAEYNDFLRHWSDYPEGEAGPGGRGKRLPYVGWFWRHVTFHDLESIPIGDCGEFVGFMANNKWDHPERNLTLEEARAVMAIVDEAMRVNQEGGESGKIQANTARDLDRLWDYMQTLEVTR